MFWSREFGGNHHQRNNNCINSKNELLSVTVTVEKCLTHSVAVHDDRSIKVSCTKSKWCVIYEVKLANWRTFRTLTLQLHRSWHLQLTKHERGASFFFYRNWGEICPDYNELFGVKFNKLCAVTYKLVHVIGTMLLTWCLNVQQNHCCQ